MQAKTPAAWVTADEVYGADPTLRAAIRSHHLGYLLAISANRHVPTPAGAIRVDRLPAQLPKRAWQKHSAGAGSHGHRYYSWAWIELLAEDPLIAGGRSYDNSPQLRSRACEFPPCWAVAGRNRLRFGMPMAVVPIREE